MVPGEAQCFMEGSQEGFSDKETFMQRQKLRNSQKRVGGWGAGIQGRGQCAYQSPEIVTCLGSLGGGAGRGAAWLKPWEQGAHRRDQDRGGD